MHEIALFVEDLAHQLIIGTLVRRIAVEHRVAVHLNWRNSVGGHGKVVTGYRRYRRDLKGQASPCDLVVAATDANCRGRRQRMREFRFQDLPVPTVLAIPDPHIERWLLLDGAAFRSVLGKGCNAPDRKCSRDRYKRLLIEAIWATGHESFLNGMDYAEDIVLHMDLDRAADADDSFSQFIGDLHAAFQHWRQ